HRQARCVRRPGGDEDAVAGAEVDRLGVQRVYRDDRAAIFERGRAGVGEDVLRALFGIQQALALGGRHARRLGAGGRVVAVDHYIAVGDQRVGSGAGVVVVDTHGDGAGDSLGVDAVVA